MSYRVIEKGAMSVRRHDRRVWYIVLWTFVAMALFSFLVHKYRENRAEAASLANFDPGYIISDYQMGNYNSMNEAQIQAFLTSKNPCSNTNYNYYLSLSANKNYTWHWKDGHFVCLSQERFGDGEVIGSGDTAAHIIWKAAQDYRINPQVLIVLLQKETSLITDPIPNSGDYRKATGYGCPDTAPCSSQYYGFKNQVRKAAALFRTVLDGGWTNYPLGNNYIQYNPNASCGGSVVNIRSLATSALYRYTPYQPNAGALAAGYGTASCGAYGNRNFYLYFQDWFGGITQSYSTKLGRAIPDGLYQISFNGGNKSIDISGGIRSNMASEKLIIFDKKTSDRDNQVFNVMYDKTTGYYRLYNPTTNLYFTVSGNSMSIEKKNDTCSQKWNLKRNSNGVYTIISACDGRSIGVSKDNSLVVNSENKTWRFSEISGRTHMIKDGLYQISTALADKYVLDIAGGVNIYKTSGTLSLWDKKSQNTDRTNQIFRVEYDNETGYYTIINTLSGLSLDVSEAKITNNSKVGVWTKNNGCNQQWLIREEGDGYGIISSCSGLYLDIPNSNANPGQKLIIYENQKAKNQRWNFSMVTETEEDYDGEYVIASRADPQKVLDIKGGIINGKKSGDIISYDRKNSGFNNQVFKFKKAGGDNEYYIYNPASGLYLDVYNGSSSDGARVIAWPFNGACNQKWKISKDRDGYYVFSSVCSNKVIDLAGSRVTNNTPLIIFPNHNGYNQKWLLFRTPSK